MSLDDLGDVPVVGRLIAAVSALLDLLANSGEVVLQVVWFLLVELDQAVPFLLSLERLAARIPVLPANAVEQLVVAAITASLTLAVVRWGRTYIGTKTDA